MPNRARAAGNDVYTPSLTGLGERVHLAFPEMNLSTHIQDVTNAIWYEDLTDIILAGFSMGTGEVTRYLGTYGAERVAKAVLVGTIPPFLLKTPDNPEGVDRAVFDGIKAAVLADRPAYIKAFLDNFYNVDTYAGTRVSDQAWQSSFIAAVGASAYATWACVDSWLTDFRDDLREINVPTLLIHGNADRILPYEATAARMPDLVKDLEFITIEGGPHNLAWTHADEVNRALLDFISR